MKEHVIQGNALDIKHPVFVFGEVYELREYEKVVIAWPDKGSVVFIINKEQCPRWRNAIPYFLPTGFRRYTIPGISVASVGPHGGILLSEEGDSAGKLVLKDGKMDLAFEVPPIPILQLHWQMLPINSDGALPGKYGKLPVLSAEESDEQENVRKRFERLTYLSMLQPNRWWVGTEDTNLTKEYLAAEFDDAKTVVADCPIYSNALYYVEQQKCSLPWQEILGQYKVVARQRGAGRIYHSTGWYQRLTDLISSK